MPWSLTVSLSILLPTIVTGVLYIVRFLRMIGGYASSLPPLVELSGLVERNMYCDTLGDLLAGCGGLNVERALSSGLELA